MLLSAGHTLDQGEKGRFLPFYEQGPAKLGPSTRQHHTVCTPLHSTALRARTFAGQQPSPSSCMPRTHAALCQALVL